MSGSIAKAQSILNYAHPSLIFIWYMLASFVASCTAKSSKAVGKPQLSNFLRRFHIIVVTLVLLTYALQLAFVAVACFRNGQWPVKDDVIVAPVSCFLVFGIQLSDLLETTPSAWYPLRGSWLISLVSQVSLTVLLATAKNGLDGPDGITGLAASTLRCALLVALLVVPGVNSWITKSSSTTSSDVERQSLLPKDDTTTQASNGENGYGAAATTTAQSQRIGEARYQRVRRERREAMEKRLEETGNWFLYIKGFSVLFPYIWPVKNRRLQIRVVGVFGCLLISNVLNLLIPRQTGIVMDSLSGNVRYNPWVAVLFFAILQLAASDSGIYLVRTWLWSPVENASRENLSRAAYSHMMHLSADFHDSKSSSDMMMAIGGGAAISDAIESVLLSAVPMLVDMGVAVVYLSVTFGAYEGLITVTTGVVFMQLAARLVSKSKNTTQDRIDARYKEYHIRQAGLQGWQTVSSFNQIGYEDNRHADAVALRWLKDLEYRMNWLLSVALQTLVLTCGLLLSAFLAVHQISSGYATPGSFAMLLMYWAQLTAPLKFFSRLGKSLSDDFMDAERLLGVMKAQPTVANKKGARPFQFTAGKVDFNEVSFSYDQQKPILKGVSLKVPPGQTVAFVGATGAGKSTLLKLLDRFYDVGSGSIQVDGQDVRDVDLFSLRDRVGVVPQNPMLFDDTIMNNVRYGKITASDEEVYRACLAAAIHDKIEGFTDGYETRVGERGVKLSGGEVQRLAIARAILKQPDIVLLDEATSAVDTDTEQKIQLSIKRLCQGRTTFVVAHRLSTIMNADRIVVVEQGEIIESGTHDELISKHGRYADLWSKQVFIKPQEEKQAGSSLFNNLSPEETAVELAKIKAGSSEEPQAVPKTQQRPDGVTATPQRTEEVVSAKDSTSLKDANSAL